MRRARSSLVGAVLSLGLLGLATCGGGLPGSDRLPGGGGKLDPNSCGAYASTDIGKKLKAFLEATVALEGAVKGTEDELKAACASMATELGKATEGSTQEVCEGVATGLKEHIQVGLKAGAKLQLDYEPAVCEVNVDVAASAAASCEASASADVSVQCAGTCNGTCDGECKGGNEGGQCNGECKGTCKGECQGYADVDASAECQATASVNANVKAECTEPKLTVGFDAAMVVDKSKLETAKKAVEAGMPALLKLGAYAKGPLRGAVEDWAKSAGDLKSSAASFKSQLGDQFLCVSGQIATAAKLAGSLASSLDVQVEMSVSVSASASAEGSAGG